MPTPTLGVKSHFESLYHSPPRLDHLRVLRCACCPSMKPFRSNKLQPKTTECIFIGYLAQYKGYICYSIKGHKLIVSRHVYFYEDIFLILPKVISTRSKSYMPTPVVHNKLLCLPQLFMYLY